MATGKAVSLTNVYFGPSISTYPSGGSVGPNETVTLLWKEGTWYYIEYNASTSKKRMYIQESAISNVSGTVSPYTANLQVRYVNNNSATYCGPDPNIYVAAGSVNLGEEVKYLYPQKTNNYALIEYTAGSQKKRAWIFDNNLSTTKPAKELGIRPVGTSFKSNDYPNYPSGNYHGGTDIGSTEGASYLNSVKASFAGTVVQVVNNVPPGTGTSYGNHVVIESTINGTTYRTWYAHLDSVDSSVSVNNGVSKGQVIGKLGNTGNCIPRSYYHTHLEYRTSPFTYQTNNVDPKTFY